jgi:ABC-2 type transport system permease protein
MSLTPRPGHGRRRAPVGESLRTASHPPQPKLEPATAAVPGTSGPAGEGSAGAQSAGAQSAGGRSGRRARPGYDDRPASQGWRIIAAKEFRDHLASARFYVLVLVLGAAGVAAIFSWSQTVRSVAPAATGVPSLFLILFTGVSGSGQQVPPFVTFIGFLAPMLGIAFGFDAVNGERSDRTLPRLLAQPIYRDDVINGKFVGGLAAISFVLVSVVAIVVGVGLLQIGVAPSAEDVLRLLVWLVLTIVYIGFWLAFAMLCSVALRRPASSALVAIALWLGLTLFGYLIAQLIAGVLSPSTSASAVADQLANRRLQETLALVSPNTLYTQATQAILDPRLSVFSVDAAIAANRQGTMPSSLLSFGQSMLGIWPQLVALVALTVVSFALAYVVFLRQEVRA